MGKTVHEVNELIKGAMSTEYTNWRGAYIAPFKNQAKSIAWDYFKQYAGGIPGIKFSETELKVDFPNGARISLYGADDPDRLRGLWLDAAVLDEYGDMNPDLWKSVVSPTLLFLHDPGRAKKAWCDFIGTPKGMNNFYKVYKDAIKNPEDWGSGFYPHTKTGLLSDAQIKQARIDCATEETFNREFLCDFSASVEDIFIPLTLAQPALGKHINEGDYHIAPKIMGIDVGGENDAHAIVKRQGLATFPVIRFHEKDHMIAAAKMANLITEWEPDAVFIDQGHGYGVISRLRQLGHTVIEVPFGSAADDDDHFVNKRAEMYSRAKDFLREGGALPDDENLLIELTTPLIKTTTSGKLQLEKKADIKQRLGSSPDTADAFVLTFAHHIKPKIFTSVFTQRKKSYDILGRFRSNGARMR